MAGGGGDHPGLQSAANDRFCPNDRVTRGQMATFLVRALDYPGTSHDWFVDDEGSVFENSINRLREAGVTQGCNPPDNSRFCPDAYRDQRPDGRIPGAGLWLHRRRIHRLLHR